MFDVGYATLLLGRCGWLLVELHILVFRQVSRVVFHPVFMHHFDLHFRLPIPNLQALKCPGSDDLFLLDHYSSPRVVTSMLCLSKSKAGFLPAELVSKCMECLVDVSVERR